MKNSADLGGCYPASVFTAKFRKPFLRGLYSAGGGRGGGLSTERNFLFKIDWASLIFGRKFTVFFNEFYGLGGGGLYMEGLIFGVLRYPTQPHFSRGGGEGKQVALIMLIAPNTAPRYKRICVATGCALPRPAGAWRLQRLILLSCLVAVFGYFTYKELQVNTLSLTKKIHIPAKRSDVFQKMFDDPESYLKIHPLGYVSVLVFSSNYFSTPFHSREVSFVYYFPNLVLISLILLMPCGFQKPRCRCEFSLLLSLVRVRQKNKILVTRI